MNDEDQSLEMIRFGAGERPASLMRGSALGVVASAALLIASSVVSLGASAQGTVGDLAEQVRALITVEGLAAQVEQIVQHQRPSGSPGENAAIDHIVATLRAAGVPVEGSYLPSLRQRSCVGQGRAGGH